ncbi:MAG: hypothetical protein KJ065_20560 [Anaerolineae bacterium]|nr:hypothetical protein [Anaerolineae bacterium]
MKIAFERSGGFAGLRITVTIDTDTLPPHEAAQLESLVEDAKFFDLPARLRSSTGGADQFQYVVTVADGERRHTVRTTDSAAPETLQPLLRRLVILARTSRRDG